MENYVPILCFILIIYTKTKIINARYGSLDYFAYNALVISL